MHHQIVAITECDWARSQQPDLSLLACSAYPIIDRADIDVIGRLTLKPQYDRLGRAMTRSGRAKRAEQLRGYAVAAIQHLPMLERQCKKASSMHGAHCVRAGRANTYLKKVECADRHNRA